MIKEEWEKANYIIVPMNIYEKMIPIDNKLFNSVIRGESGNQRTQMGDPLFETDY
jgi:hypothetical protein